MSRPVTTSPRANHKAARLPTPMLDALLEDLGEGALAPADLKARLRNRTLRAIRRARPASPRPVLADFDLVLGGEG